MERRWEKHAASSIYRQIYNTRCGNKKLRNPPLFLCSIPCHFSRPDFGYRSKFGLSCSPFKAFSLIRPVSINESRLHNSIFLSIRTSHNLLRIAPSWSPPCCSAHTPFALFTSSWLAPGPHNMWRHRKQPWTGLLTEPTPFPLPL